MRACAACPFSRLRAPDVRRYRSMRALPAAASATVDLRGARHAHDASLGGDSAGIRVAPVAAAITVRYQFRYEYRSLIVELLSRCQAKLPGFG